MVAFVSCLLFGLDYPTIYRVRFLNELFVWIHILQDDDPGAGKKNVVPLGL
jgi:hypothetical protein